jgi:beta-glucuronidase
MIRPSFLLPFVLLPLAAFAAPLPDLALHPAQSLDGEWRIIIDPYETGFYDYRFKQRDESPTPARSESFFLDSKPTNLTERVEYDFDQSPVLRVPGDWNTQRPDLFFYEGTVWYRKTFPHPGLTNGHRAFVRFGAVNYRADVYLNGKKLGVHIGGFTPFSFEVTALLRPGTNSLVVKVDNKRTADGVPTLNTDWFNYGGITRSVHLVTTPPTFVSEHRLWLESETTRRISGWVQLSATNAGAEVVVALPELKESVRVTTDASGRAAFALAPKALELWSPENPKRYDVTLAHGGQTLTDRIGFRTVRTEGRNLLVNGKPVFLRGICTHEELPLQGGGRVNSPEKAKQLLTWARELNCNFVRLAHYPHNEDMTRLADELGLMVWSEVPVYWTINWTNDATYRNAENQLVENITRDANRASVIIWSLANETPVGEARTAFLTRLGKKARSLDTTRLISAALEKHVKPNAPNVMVVEDPLADQLDVLAFNQYVGWYDGLPPRCAEVTWEIPYQKPLFISEFGGDAKAGRHGDKSERWNEEFQEELYRQTFQMIEKIDGLAGFTPWILVDFRSPKRVLPGIQDGFNRKGLVSSDGEKKKAFFVLQDYYAKKKAP